LNVFAPHNVTNLPVLVWIHGGGYGQRNGGQNLAPIIQENNGSFIGVSIQYRLGAFGFLSSDEVNRFGVVNAGIRNQEFALQWVQSYIHLFGGNSLQVTISGESAGTGSVMLLAMAYGGTLGTSLFSNVSFKSMGDKQS
jgi:carboxylesterase type B